MKVSEDQDERVSALAIQQVAYNASGIQCVRHAICLKGSASISDLHTTVIGKYPTRTAERKTGTGGKPEVEFVQGLQVGVLQYEASQGAIWLGEVTCATVVLYDINEVRRCLMQVGSQFLSVRIGF